MWPYPDQVGRPNFETSTYNTSNLLQKDETFDKP